MKKLTFIDREVEFNSSSDGLLLWPAEWEDELRSHGFIDAAVQILLHLPSCAVQVPWVIGSASKDLSGRLRSESTSHMNGLAFDMSPMYSADSLLPPDKTIMGMAWNLVSLDMLSSAYAEYPHFVVEGDHLHVQPHARLFSDRMVTALTMPTWYPWTTSIMQCADTADMCGTMWVWSLTNPEMRLATPQEVAQLLSDLQQ